jgi:hypothetical protein
MHKKGKTVQLNNFNNHKVKYGTIDVTDNKSVYLTLSTWITPKNTNAQPEQLVSTINKRVRTHIHAYLNTVTNHGFRYIVDTDLRSSGIRTGKKSFMSSDITLFVNTKFDNISDYIEKMSEYIIANIETDYSQLLDFSKNKK